MQKAPRVSWGVLARRDVFHTCNERTRHVFGDGDLGTGGAHGAAGFGREGSLFEHLAGEASLELAGGSFGKLSCLEHDDLLYGDAELADDGVTHTLFEVLGSVRGGFNADEDLFGAAPASREGDDVSGAYAVEVVEWPLDGLRVNVSAVDDDEVFDASGDVD